MELLEKKYCLHNISRRTKKNIFFIQPKKNFLFVATKDGSTVSSSSVWQYKSSKAAWPGSIAKCVISDTVINDSHAKL